MAMTNETIAVADNFYSIVEEVCKELYIKALKDIPPDVREALKKAREKENDPVAKEIFETIFKSIEISDKDSMLICQDTGIPIYWVEIGTKLIINGIALQEAITRGTQRATLEHPLRSSVVSPLRRQNNQSSTGYRVPIIHFEFIKDADYLNIKMVPKGSGSEQMSFLKMLIPADGITGIKKYVLNCVVEAGANPCPSTIVGIGIGGTADYCAYLAKKAATRRVGSSNPDPEIAALEKELLEYINESGIGPMGLGGNNTALAVHIEQAYTHITQNPVAVNMQCWAARRAAARIYGDGRKELGY
ncbi:MAG: fumarate hydratase [Peptococcaceae bacterium]